MRGEKVLSVSTALWSTVVSQNYSNGPVIPVALESTALPITLPSWPSESPATQPLTVGPPSSHQESPCETERPLPYPSRSISPHSPHYGETTTSTEAPYETLLPQPSSQAPIEYPTIVIPLPPSSTPPQEYPATSDTLAIPFPPIPTYGAPSVTVTVTVLPPASNTSITPRPPTSYNPVEPPVSTPTETPAVPLPPYSNSTVLSPPAPSKTSVALSAKPSSSEAPLPSVSAGSPATSLTSGVPSYIPISPSHVEVSSKPSTLRTTTSARGPAESSSAPELSTAPSPSAQRTSIAPSPSANSTPTASSTSIHARTFSAKSTSVAPTNIEIPPAPPSQTGAGSSIQSSKSKEKVWWLAFLLPVVFMA